MTFGPILSWLARRSLAHPGAWLFLLSCSALPVLISVLGPLGVGPFWGHSSAIFYEVAFIAEVFGILAGAKCLEDLDFLMKRLPVRRALAIEIVTLGFSSLGAAIAVCVPVVLLVPSTSIEPSPWWGIPVVALHLAALMILFRRTRMTSEVRSIALVTTAWALPSMGNGGAGLVGYLKTLLGAPQALELSTTPVPWTVTVAPIIALVLVSMSLDLLRRSTP